MRFKVSDHFRFSPMKHYEHGQNIKTLTIYRPGHSGGVIMGQEGQVILGVVVDSSGLPTGYADIAMTLSEAKTLRDLLTELIGAYPSVHDYQTLMEISK